MWICRW